MGEKSDQFSLQKALRSEAVSNLSEVSREQLAQIVDGADVSPDPSLPGDDEDDEREEITSAATEEHDGEVNGLEGSNLVNSWAARTVHIGGALVMLLGTAKRSAIAGGATKMLSYAPEFSISLFSALQSPHATVPV